MRTRYQVKFESDLSTTTALNNYEYLDILDRAWGNRTHPRGGVLCDVGSASFWYARALAAFFSPVELAGIEIEGHRLFKDGRTRVDYAAGYVEGIPGARFVVADYGEIEFPADIIIAWFPFLTANAILAWRLPLSLLRPEKLYHRVFHNLRPGGRFVMVNHGAEEARLARQWCNAAKLHLEFEFAEAGGLSGHRQQPPILTCWSRS